MWFISNELWPGSLCFHWRGDWSYSGQIPHQQVWKNQKHITPVPQGTASGCRVPLPCSLLMKNRKTHEPKYSFNLHMELVKHTGGCHCGAVRFEVWSSPDLHVFHCKYVHSVIQKYVSVLTNVWCIKKTDLYKLNCLSLAVASAQRNKTIISLFQQVSSSSYR